MFALSLQVLTLSFTYFKPYRAFPICIR